MKKVILSIAAVSAFFVGCKKDDDNTLTRRQMIVGNWDLSQFGFDANNNGVLDQGETAPASSATVDGTFTFNDNGTATATATFLGDTDTVSGNWALVNSDSWLMTALDGDTAYLEIKSVAGNSMTLRDSTDAMLNQATWYVLSK